MKSLPSEFKLFDRGAKETILLIPGWATDYRIFGSLDLDFNYLMPINFSPYDFEKKLIATLKKNGLDKISLLGWSMGGFIASDFLSRHRERIDEIIFIAIRQSYEKETLEEIKSYLKRSRKTYLYKFYRDCFSKKEEEALSWFKRNLLRSYLGQMDLDLLLEGLDYLSSAQLRLRELKRLKIKFIHGKVDKIAPIEEALRIKESLPQAKFISIKGAGHMPFLTPDFKRIFYEAYDE